MPKEAKPKRNKSRDHVPGLYQRKTGAWLLDTRIRGERYVVNLGRGFRRTIAREKAERARADLSEGKIEKWLPQRAAIQNSDDTLSEYSKRWLTAVEGELETRTFNRYKLDLERHVLPKLGNLKLKDITTATVKGFLRGKRNEVYKRGVNGEPDRKYAPDTVRLMRAALSVVLSEAAEDGLIASNPALYRGGRRRRVGAMTRTQRAAAIRPMDWNERERFRQSARETHLAALFETMVKTGVRPSEAYALRIDDLDLESRKLRVERSLVLTTKEIKSTKTEEIRSVDVSPELAELLRSHLVALRRHALENGWSDLVWLFPSKVNGSLDHNNVARVFRRVLKTAKLPGFRLYDLRHTFASGLLSRGAPLAYVAAQLGHAKPETTLRFYTKWIPSEGESYSSLLDLKPDASKSSSTFHSTHENRTTVSKR